MNTIPKIFFIVPYRDRKEHKQFFMKYMEFIMEDYNKDDYELFFVHQCDKQPFNRGAMKNIGFLAMKSKYPQHYHDITIVFNDVDTVPYTKNLLNYETKRNTIKHFYGYNFALGGIVSITGYDFEKINGYPNMWGWSMEDNILQKRALANNIYIDRTTFFPIGSTSILQFVDAINKIINKREMADCLENTYPYGLTNIINLNFNYEDEYIQVTNFQTETNPNIQPFENHDITKGNGRIIVNKKKYGTKYNNPNKHENKNANKYSNIKSLNLSGNLFR